MKKLWSGQQLLWPRTVLEVPCARNRVEFACGTETLKKLFSLSPGQRENALAVQCSAVQRERFANSAAQGPPHQLRVTRMTCHPYSEVYNSDLKAELDFALNNLWCSLISAIGLPHTKFLTLFAILNIHNHGNNTCIYCDHYMNESTKL